MPPVTKNLIIVNLIIWAAMALFPQEIDEDLYTRPPRDENDKKERMLNPRKLRTRLMFCDLLEE